MDNDDKVLAAIHANINALLAEFWAAPAEDRPGLRLKLNDLYDAEAKAKIALLDEEVQCTAAHVDEVLKIGQEISKIADATALAMAIVRLTAFLIALA